MPRSYSGKALGRLLQIISLVYSNGAAPLRQADLAAAVGCCERQLARYVKAIREGGILLENTGSRGYFIEKGQLPFEIQLTLQEALGLLMCRESTAGAGRQPFAHSTESAFEKIAGVLPARMRSLVESTTIRHVGGARRDYSGGPWGAIMAACRERRVLEIDYYTISRDERSLRKVDPYCVVWLAGYCHLVAYCHTREKVIHFSLDSIERAADMGAVFEPQPGFSLAEHLKNAGPNPGAPTQITVVFDAEMARYAKRRTWDFENQLTPLPDGSLRMTATVRGLADIRRELLSWGRHVEVIEPLELRQLMAEEAGAMAARYKRVEGRGRG